MKTVTLTKRQDEILNFIKSYHASVGIMPSRLEVATHFQFNANAAHQHITSIEKKGAIKIVPGVSRGIVINNDINIKVAE